MREHGDHVVARMHAPVGDDAAEVLVTAPATLARARSSSKPALITVDRAAVEHREVFARQAEHPRDDEHREREGELANKVGALVGPVDERVDVLVDHVADELAFPRFHRFAAERLLHQVPLRVVLGLVHLEDGVAEHLAHDVGVARGRERLAVLQHLLHGVEAVRGVDADAAIDRHELDVAAFGYEHRVVDVLALHRVLRTHEREQRIWILDESHARALWLNSSNGSQSSSFTAAMPRTRSTVRVCAWRLDQVNLGLLVLRVAVGATMIAHGYSHIYRGGKIKGTAGWFASSGMKPGILHAWLASSRSSIAGAALGAWPAHAARGGCDHRRRARWRSSRITAKPGFSCSTARPKGGSTS